MKKLDIFHIKVFKKPKKCFSIIYKVEKKIQNSHFVRIEDYKDILWRPGIDPQWLDVALEWQKQSLDLARKYVFLKLQKASISSDYSFSVGWDWNISEYKNDEFTNNVINLVMQEEE